MSIRNIHRRIRFESLRQRECMAGDACLVIEQPVEPTETDIESPTIETPAASSEESTPKDADHGPSDSTDTGEKLQEVIEDFDIFATAYQTDTSEESLRALADDPSIWQRARRYEAIVKGDIIPVLPTAEAFDQVLRDVKGLALEITLD